MRAIKFRAWDKSLKQMVEVGQWDFGDSEHIHVRLLPINGKAPHSYWQSMGNLELLQFTGLKDRAGVELYEGDVVIADGTKADIFYTDRYCAFELRATGNPIGFYRDIEKVGNIYERTESA